MFAAMVAPAQYEADRKQGKREALPWYLTYIRTAQFLGCNPWDLIDAPTPRHFWFQAGLIVANAEMDAKEERARNERILAESAAHAAALKQQQPRRR